MRLRTDQSRSLNDRWCSRTRSAVSDMGASGCVVRTARTLWPQAVLRTGRTPGFGSGVQQIVLDGEERRRRACRDARLRVHILEMEVDRLGRYLQRLCGLLDRRA